MRDSSTLIGILATFAHLLVPPVNGIQIQVDASQETGVFKNTQNTNWPIIGYPGPTDKLLANHWDESRTNQIFIYPTPRYLFTGYDQTGIASDPTLIQNYNFTELDEQMRYVVSTGRKASIQFEDHLGPEYATPEMFEEVGYTIADRYGNGANGSGFNDALELIDFFPERDLTNATLTESEVQRFHALVQGFAIGVHRANTSAGVGAFSSNRFWISPSIPQNPYNEPFFEFVAKNKVPIKAITFHWLSPLTQAPGDLIESTRRVRNELDKMGLQNIPIWITEYNRNPAGFYPKNETIKAEYDDLGLCNAYIQSAQIYAQEAPLEQIFVWPGVSHGFVGMGDAYFEGYYELNSNGTDQVNQIGTGWELSGRFIRDTPNRLEATKFSSDGLAWLAGISNDKNTVQILTSNYQVPDDVLAGVTEVYGEYSNSSAPGFCASTTPEELWCSEYFCYDIAPLPGLCLSTPQPHLNTNHAQVYDITIENLPWTPENQYLVTIERTSPHAIRETVEHTIGTGNSININIEAPANAVDLVSIAKIVDAKPPGTCRPVQR